LTSAEKQLQQVRNELQVGPIKTNAGKRNLPLLDPVPEEFNQHQAIAEDACCTEFSEAFAAQPDVALCTQSLHSPAPDMFSLA
jgi:hypothetical protein